MTILFDSPKLATIVAGGRAALRTKGGFTIDTRTGTLVEGIDVWAVSLRGYEACFVTEPTTAEWEAYLRAHAVNLSEPGHHFGGWDAGWNFKPYTGGRYTFDVSVLVASRETAIALAFHHGQKAISHLLTGEEVYVSDVIRSLEEAVALARRHGLDTIINPATGATVDVGQESVAA